MRKGAIILLVILLLLLWKAPETVSSAASGIWHGSIQVAQSFAKG